MVAKEILPDNGLMAFVEVSVHYISVLVILPAVLFKF